MEKLRIDDFTKYKFLSTLKKNENGSKTLFVVHEADMENNDYKSFIWCLDNETKKYVQLTGMGKEKNFYFTDDETVLFPSVRDEKDREKLKNGEEFTQFFKMSLNGGEALPCFRIPKTVTSIKPLKDNDYLIKVYENIDKPDISKMDDSEKEKALKEMKEEKDYEVLEEIPFWSNGGGYTNKKRSRLYLYNSENGYLEPLTEKTWSVGTVHLIDNNDKILFTASDFNGKMELTNKVYVYSFKSKEISEISGEKDFRYMDVHPLGDDRYFTVGTDMKAYGVNENPKFYILDSKNKTLNCITPELDMSPGNSVGSDCRLGASGSDSYLTKEGDYYYFVTTKNHNSILNRIDASGKIETLIEEEGSVDDFIILDGEIIFSGFRKNELLELYTHKDNSEIKLTCLNSSKNDKYVGTPEHLSFETEAGITVDGWIIKPKDFDESKKYPAIFDIHGGPKTAYGSIYFHEMQYWANEGYAVFFCNPRGSSGKGNDFADIRGKYGTIDYDDLMKFVDVVLEKYVFIDKDRIGVTGGSYGGFMTNWIIGQTDRFAAAASQRSISNWISKFCTTDIGFYFVDDQIGSTPWNDVDNLWKQSPLKYADKVKTPTLFIHSEEDYRCWYPEGLQMFTALKYFGVESRLCMFRGENHELSRSGKPKHRIRRLKEITEWFDKYLK